MQNCSEHEGEQNSGIVNADWVSGKIEVRDVETSHALLVTLILRIKTANI